MSVHALIAPATRYEAPELVDLSDRAVRAELVRAAIPAMVRLAEEWQVKPDQMCALLGGISASTWYSWKHDAPSDLSIDQLTRVSYLLGIYTALRSLFRQPLAEDWVSRPNTDPLFAGDTPIAVMASGGIVVLAQVRAMLDGARGGV